MVARIRNWRQEFNCVIQFHHPNNQFSARNAAFESHPACTNQTIAQTECGRKPHCATVCLVSACVYVYS